MRALIEGEDEHAADLLERARDGNTIDLEMDETDKYGNTLLHLAVLCKGTSVTERLLAIRPDLASKCNSESDTALHKCARSDLSSAVDHAMLIVQANPAVLNLKDKEQRTPFAIAKAASSGRGRKWKRVDLAARGRA